MNKDESTEDIARKLDVIRSAAQHDSPVCDIETMLAEIEMGRSETSGADLTHKIEE
jgi:hypothetical protein